MEKISKMLKEKRLELGLTVEDISEQTRLTQKHIKALEEGNLDFFQDDLTYLRFFVKSYCEAVGIDFEEIKDELRESVNDYTQTITMSAIQEHEDIERNIANSDKLSKVQRVDEKPAKVRKRPKDPKRKPSLKKVDFSLVSLIAVVSVVVIVLACALVIFMKSMNNHTDTAKNKDQPIADKQGNKGDNEYPTTSSKKKEETKKKDIEVTKTGTTQYTIDNVSDGDELTFEISLNNTNTSLTFMVNGETMSDPAPQLYNFNSVAKAKIKAKKNMKIVIYYGMAYDQTMKINGKTVRIDDSILGSQNSANLEFTVMGDE